MDSMTAYQYRTLDTSVYPGAGNGTLEAVSYVTLGLVGEAGEIANKAKKLIRDSDTPAKRAELSGELGDVLFYLARLCDELGFSLSGIAAENLDKLSDRKVRGVLRGAGDAR